MGVPLQGGHRRQWSRPYPGLEEIGVVRGENPQVQERERWAIRAFRQGEAGLRGGPLNMATGSTGVDGLQTRQQGVLLFQQLQPRERTLKAIRKGVFTES